MDSGVVMQSKDPYIKLFGRTIPLPEIQIQGNSKSQRLMTEEHGEIMKAEGEIFHEEESEESTKVSQDNHGNDQTPVQMSKARAPKLEDQLELGAMSDQKSLKKPEKILPCPRCNSSDTKFCYFNNYNVLQPRHFCKNCQRYWTAGGTMRNVPVGAGRRKNKHLTSQYRQMIVSSQVMPNNRMETTDTIDHGPPVENGTLLKFSPDATLCDSVQTLFNPKDQSAHTDMSNARENMEEPSLSGSSSITASSFQEPALPHQIMKRDQSGLSCPSDNVLSQHPLNCYPVPSWSLPWSPGWNGVPLQLIPASYLGCLPMPVWPAAQGVVRGANGCNPSSFSTTNGSASNSSPTLGKHSRDTKLTEYENSGSCIIVPKLLRIDELNEGSNSPILTTLGVCPGRKCLQPSAKAGGNSRDPDANQFLEANPAALCRSHIFQEST